MIADLPKPRYRSPGRRGIAADTYAFPVKLAMEAPFQLHPEYRRLRYAFDAAERRLHRLSAIGASSTRVANAQTAVNAAGASIAGFLLRNIQAAEPTPVVLERTFGPDGVLESEVETPVSPTTETP